MIPFAPANLKLELIGKYSNKSVKGCYLILEETSC